MSEPYEPREDDVLTVFYWFDDEPVDGDELWATAMGHGDEVPIEDERGTHRCTDRAVAGRQDPPDSVQPARVA